MPAHGLSRNFALAIASLASAFALGGCAATKLAEPISGYTCCNLRVNDGWISRDNVQDGTMIPAGEAVRLDSIKRKIYVYATIGKEEYAFRDDSSKSESDTLKWLRRIVVSEDPRRRLVGWTSEVKTAVSVGRVFAGMSREQVAMAIGYPAPADTADLTTLTWRYWTAVDDTPVDIQFSPDGRVLQLDGTQTAIRSIEFVH